MSKKEKPSTELATEHWNWLETLLRKVYVDAFIHGYKHANDRKRRKYGDKKVSS